MKKLSTFHWLQILAAINGLPSARCAHDSHTSSAKAVKSFMRTTLLLVAMSALAPTVAPAQCVYRVTASGNFSDPNIYSVTGGASCGAVPPSNVDGITIIIDGFNVKMDRNYTLDRLGSITLSHGGSLTGDFTLTIGDGTSAQNDTYLTLASGSTVDVEQLNINKATIRVAGPGLQFPRSVLATDCNMLLNNSEIMVDGLTLIHGNLDLTAQKANNSVCTTGAGAVIIAGCVYGTPGHKQQVVHGCPGLNVCVRMLPTTCPGPISAQSAEEKECDLLLSNTLAGCQQLPLPVELAWFTAMPDERRGGVALRWATASELNCKSFTVERSADGRAFRDLSTQAGAGTSTRFIAYEATDDFPLPGLSYYRLRQSDHNGTLTYSPMRAVQPARGPSAGLEVYPGRSAQEWVVSTGTSSGAPGQLNVLDVLGRPQPAPCSPDPAHPGRWALDLQALAAGVYLVRLSTDAGTFSRRVMR